MIDSVTIGKSQQVATLALCPQCHAGPLDGAFRVKPGPLKEDGPPAIGNITVCAYCAAILVWVDDGTCLALRLADSRLLARLRRNRRLFRMVRVLVQAIRGNMDRAGRG